MAYTTLVDTDTLGSKLQDPRWIIFDCRFVLTDVEAGRRAYSEGHVPGARYAHLDEDLSSPITPESGRHPLPDAVVLVHKLGRWGVDSTKQVVVYDDSAGAIAARLWWLLRWLGHYDVAVLDGGFPKWEREQRPVTKETPKTTPTVYRGRPNDDLWVGTRFVEDVITHGERLLIDVRSPERFRGEVEPLDKIAGHIPGAVNYPLEKNLGPDGCFLDAAQLRDQFRGQLNHMKPDRVITSCGSGVTACHSILAMEHAGLSAAKLYVGSWSEWIRDNRRPIATGA